MASTVPRRWGSFALYRTVFRLLGLLPAPIELPVDIHLDRLDSPVEITWNEGRVPNIRAQTLTDAVCAEGYIHGHFRAFQMDVFRRMPAGELAELLGPAALPNDRFMRRLHLRYWARQSQEQLPLATRAILNAYVDGVNQAFEKSPLAPEYRFLKTTPRPWTVEDTLTLVYTLAWQLNSIWTHKWAFDQLGHDQGAMHWLFADIPGAPDITILPGTGSVPGGWGKGTQGIGSNNWVVGGTRTESGLPLLANDPHLMPLLPSIWFQVAIQGGPLDVVGASLPGSPAIIIGQNQSIAWGVTNVNPDCQDLYRIRMDDETHYRLDGERSELDIKTELIGIRGGQDIPLVVEDSHAGPIIHREPDGSRIALDWTGLAPVTLVDSLIQLNLAKDWNTFNQALLGWQVPSQNFVYADVQGHIGYVLAGQIPTRSSGPVYGCADGNTRQTLWTGTIPWDKMPRLFDPDSQFIVTANNAPAGQDYEPKILSGNSLGYRAERIKNLLQATDRHTPKSFARIQIDTYSSPLQRLSKRLLHEPELPKDWRCHLEHFDGFAAKDSVAPTLLYLWSMHAVPQPVQEELARPFFFDVAPKSPGDHPFPENFWGLMGERLIPMVLDRFAELDHSRAFQLAQNLGEKAFGPNVSRWSWGAAHQTALFHPFMAMGPTKAVFGHRPIPTSGDYFTPMQAAFAVDPALPWSRPVLFTPSYRQILVPGDPKAGLFMQMTGQSGHPLDPNYDNFVAPYFAGEFLSRAIQDRVTTMSPKVPYRREFKET